MYVEIENKKKEIFNNFGFIDDHSQTMEDCIKQQENKNNLLKNLIHDEEKIINYKQRLRYIMQRKSDKSLEFFCSTQNLFVKLYDTMIKAKTANETEETGQATKLLKREKVDLIKEKFKTKISNLQTKLEELKNKEDNICSSINKYRVKDNIEHVFEGASGFEFSNKPNT